MRKRDRKILARIRTAAFTLLILAATALFLGPGCCIIPSDMNPTLPIVTIKPTPTESGIISSTLQISEIMTANRTTLKTADGGTPDWVEIHNTGSSSINLQGYCLSDNVKKPAAWQFPAVTLEAGGYLVVYASGLKSTAESDAAREIHADFRLSSKGEELVLTNPKGQVLARVVIPDLPADISYGLLDTAEGTAPPYYFFGVPTPGKANGLDGKTTAEEAIPHLDFDLVVNEYMTDNRFYPDLDGDLSDWVELYNPGSEPVSLQGFFLSDDAADPEKHEMPDVTVKPGEYLLIWLSGKDKEYDPAWPLSLHASFRLGRQDRELIMTEPRGSLVLRQVIVSLPMNVSYGRKSGSPDQWLYFPEATPGASNDTAGHEELSGAISLSNRGVWINEVLASDAAFSGSKKTVNSDWVELHNGTDQIVDLSGYGLSDDPKDLYRMLLPDGAIGPGEYLAFDLQGFGLSTNGETLYLTNADGKVIDSFTSGFLRNGCSSGRGNSGGSEPADSRFFYMNPTKGAANTSEAFIGMTPVPRIATALASGSSAAPRLYPGEPVLATLTCPFSGAVIRYTLDGSEPNGQSAVYSEPLRISQDSVVSCKAFAPGCLPSGTVCETFLFDERHDLPVISIAISPDDFTGSQGLWTQFELGLEKKSKVTFYEADGTPGVSFHAGIALHGSYGRSEKQKSLEMNLREFYGDFQVIYPFFPDNEVTAFKRLILRTSGQDWKISKLRDAFMSEVVEDDLAVDTMDWRPCVVYVNGDYYGLYEIREDIDEYYMKAHFGVNPDKVDIIKGNSRMLHGTFTAYKELLTYVKEHDLREQDPYEYVLSRIDEQSLTDWVIAQTFFNNLDSGNKKFWCENTAGGQWRWAFFDLDWAMFPSTYKINILKYDLLDPDGHGQQNIFNSSLQVKLMQNPAFEKAFIERYAELINTTFQTDRMLGILDSMTEQIRSEMPRQIERWGQPSSLAVWQKNVGTLRRITGEKRALAQAVLQESFNLSTARMQELFPGEY